MGINEALLGVIDELYAGALDHARLSAGLGRAAQLVSASGGMLYTHYNGENNMRFAVFSNIDLKRLVEIDAQSAKMVAQRTLQIPLGHIQGVAATWPIDEMKKSTFYHDVLRPLNILHGAAGLAVRNSEYYGVVSLTRTEREGPFSDEQFGILKALVPHFRNVLQITNAMGAMSLASENTAAALNSLSDGVVLTDDRGRVIYLNRAAERAVAGNDGLSIKNGRLAAEISDEERALHQLIGQAARNHGTSSLERGGNCAISRPSGARPWLILTMPCGATPMERFASVHPVCLVLIRDPEWRSKVPGDRLRQLFGLTRQEARVAIAAAEGRGLQHVAGQMGLSSLTVRNHLQRVFAKTGTSRQAELAHFVGTLAN